MADDLDCMVTFVAKDFGLAHNWAKRASLTAEHLRPTNAAFAGTTFVCVDTRPGALMHSRTHAPLLHHMDYMIALCPGCGQFCVQFAKARPMKIVARWAMVSQDPAADSFNQEMTQLVFPAETLLRELQRAIAGGDQNNPHHQNDPFSDYALAYRLETFMAMPETQANKRHRAIIMTRQDTAYKWAAYEAMVTLEAGPCSQ